jgi:2-C-methyl-D-erythritol 4-phosphate cytidylyltransferase
MKRVAVIVAGGSGTRMGMEVPKQFLQLNGKAILIHAISAFVHAYPDIHIVLVLPKEYIELAKELVGQESLTPNIEFVEGGATRFDSVKNGLQHINDAELIFVHDAVRCLVSTDLIQTCSESASQQGSAIPVIPVRDSMRRLDTDDQSSVIVNRENLVIVQTPQTFKKDILLSAFDVDYSPSFTDEASVVEAAGYQVHLVPGEETNIKITFPNDLHYAEWRLNRN